MDKNRKFLAIFFSAFIILDILLAGFFIIFRHWKGFVGKPGVLRVLVTQADMDSDMDMDLDSPGFHRTEMPIDRERVILKKFAEANDLKLEYVPVPAFAQLFEALLIGSGDLVSANLAATKNRINKYRLSVPFIYTREVLFISDRIPRKKTLEETLSGLTGQLLPGTSYVDNLKKFAQENPFIKFTELKNTISHDELIQLVADGEIPFSVLNECDLDDWLAYNTGIRKVALVQKRVPLVFAAKKSSRALINKLNAFIHEAELDTEPIPEMEEPIGEDFELLAENVEPVAEKTEPETKPVPKPENTENTVNTENKKKTEKNLYPVPAQNKQPKETVKKAAVKKAAVKKMDLDSIRKRGFIRIITRNEYYCCFLERGEPSGFEYELARKFAKELGVELFVIIPPDFQSMTKYLEEGKGDFIAANYTRTDERIQMYPELTFCDPYCGTAEFLVGRENEKITKFEDLKGRKIHIRQSSSYYQSLLKYQKAGKYTIVPAPEDEDTLQIIKNVSSGKYDLTAADDAILNLALISGSKVRKIFQLTEKRPYAWVVRKQDKKLTEAVNKFFKQEHKSAFFNTIVKRYYKNEKKQKQAAPLLLSKQGIAISPYDLLFQKYGELYDFNWYFLAAQAFHESHFKPDAVSGCGAVCLMQVMPKTAQEIGINDLKTPENGIHAGAKYMAKLIDRFSDDMTEQDQLCFALASYNAGYGHVLDARKLAKKKGWNPNVWFNNTERALALLETPQYASKAKYGFCRASETIPYVRNIMRHANYYQQILKNMDANSKQQKKK